MPIICKEQNCDDKKKIENWHHTLNVIESLEVGAAGNSLLTTGATTSLSVCPQNWYWQNTKCDREGGSPAACLMHTYEGEQKNLSVWCLQIGSDI